MSAITVCVGNYGYYNEGRLHDTWIDLPVEPSTFKPWLVEHRLWDRRHEETYISDYDGIPLGCSYGNVFSEHTSLEHLNALAQLMEMLPLEAETLASFIETSGEEPDDLLGLANWLLQADSLPYYTYDVPSWCANDSAEEKYGYQLANGTLWWEALEANGVSDHFDLEAFGREWSANCALGDDGYVDLCQDFPDQDRYSWDDITAMMPWNDNNDRE